MWFKLILWLFLLSLCWLPGLSEASPEDVVVESSTEPTHIDIPSIGVDANIFEYTNEMVNETGGTVDPEYMDDVAWWSGGGRPGATLSNTVDTPELVDFTVFLYGHSSNNDDRKVVFDDLDLLTTNDQIFIDTEVGQFVYIVDSVFILEKPDFTADSRILEDIPGRLLLISCWRSWSGAAPTTENVVVIANLVGN